jgi:hypothetical protein
MFPETDFHRLGATIFLIIGGRYYNASHSEAANENYLTLCSLRFPLKRGRTIQEEEANYFKKNSGTLAKCKEEIGKQINLSDSCFQEIQRDISEKEEILFFLDNICKPHNGKVKAEKSAVQAYRERISVLSPEVYEEGPILPKMLDKNYLAINGRLYPLLEEKAPVFVSLEGKNYTIQGSDRTIDQIESDFNKILHQRIKRQVIKNSGMVEDLEGKANNLQEEINSLITNLNVSVYPHCYEFGDIGYDKKIMSVYWLIAPHHNKTTGKSYGEGQSAGTLRLNKGELATSALFADRGDRNSQFTISTSSHCLGFSLRGNSLEDKMQYLHTFANVVNKNGAFHE